MATTTFQPYTGNGSNKTFNYSFPTYTASEVVVEVDGVVVDNYTIPGYQTTGTRTVTFDNSTGTLNTDLCESDGAPKNNLEVIVRRDTNIDTAKANYTAGSSLKAADLTNNNTQILRALQEEQNTPTTTPRIRDQAITSAKIKNLTIVDEDISATAEIEVYKLKDGAANQVLVTQPDGTTVNWTSNVDLPGTLDVTGNVDFDSNLNVDGTTTLDATTVDGVLDVNGSATIDNVQVNGNEIDTTSGNLTIDSAGGDVLIDDNARVTGTFTVDGLTTYPANVVVTGSQLKIQADNSEFAVNNGSGVTKFKVDSDNGDTLIQGTASIANIDGAAVVTSGTSTSDTKFYSAKRAGELFYGKGTVEEIQSGETWAAADDKVATTAAIDARIIDLVDDVGGFVPIANETSFPNANPDVNNGAGTLVSIKTIGSTRTPSTGTVTIANGSGSNTVTITGCGSTVLTAGFGVIVETTTTLHTYAFHRLVPKATEVTTVASKATEVTTVHTNITNVNTVATNISDINAVAADATDIGAVAAKATEIGRLGTADAAADMAILGTADVVADMAILGTNDVVADLNTLGTADVVADMNTLATADIVSDMNALATSDNITAMDTCRDNISSITNCSTNISSVNTFGDQYQVASNNPSTDGGGNALAAGDLYFNTSANELKVYNGSSWQGGVTATGNFAVTTGNTFTGDNRYNDGVKALFGTDSDFEIYHNGSTNYGHIRNIGQGTIIQSAIFNVKNAGATKDMIVATTNNSVDLYYDNSKKFETTGSGATVTGSLGVGTSSPTNTLHINGDGIIRVTNSAGANQFESGRIRFTENTNDFQGAYVHYDGYSNIFHIGTHAANDTVVGNDLNAISIARGTGNVQMPNVQIPNDSGKLQLGASQDLELYHTGTNNHIDSVNGALVIRSDVFQLSTLDGTHKYINIPTNEQRVELYYDNVKRFETQPDGCHVFGTGGLQIYGEGNSNALLDLFPTGSAVYSTIRLNNAAGSTSSSLSTLGGATLYISSGSGGNIVYRGTGTGDHVFETNGVERMRIDDANIKLPDNQQILFGAGSDFKIFHESSSNENIIDCATTIPLRVRMGGSNVFEFLSGGGVKMNDGKKLILGDSADLQIYHDGNHSIITDAGTGNLRVQTNNLRIENAAGTQNQALFTEGGSVELYHANSKKFETISNGANITGGLNIDGGTIHNTYDATLHVTATNNNDWGAIIDKYNGSANEYGLRVDVGSSASYAVQVTGNNSSVFRVAGNGNVYANEFHGDGSNLTGINTDLVSDTSPQLGGDLDTNDHEIFLDDNHAIKFGAGNDLVIESDGTNGFIKNHVGGAIYVRANANVQLMTNASSGGADNAVTCVNNGAVKLYYDNDQKIETTSYGISVGGNAGSISATKGIEISNAATTEIRLKNTSGGSANTDGFGIQKWSNGVTYLFEYDNQDIIVGTNNASRWRFVSTGHFEPMASNSYDIGSSSKRVRNIYTNDLHLSNEGHSNDVDGTWGDWTMQEGESDLFLKNNRSGKKYKFNLTEVS